jgi:hypothetical protein
VVQANQRFLTSSPPYDLGEGIVHGFIYAWIRDNKVLGISAYEVPPWAYNGPTSIVPDMQTPDGKKWRKISRRNGLTKKLRTGEINLSEYRERMNDADHLGWDVVEVDFALKRQDMDIVPHPFCSAEPGDTVVLLDPMDTFLIQLLDAQNDGEDIAGLLYEQRIRLDNEPLRRAGPKGVTQVSFKA